MGLFVQFDGIFGQGSGAYPRWTPLMSLSLGAGGSSGHGVGASGTGKVVVREAALTRMMDGSSPKFAEACTSGRAFAQVKFVNDGLQPQDDGTGSAAITPSPKVTMTFSNVMVTSYQASFGQPPTETFRISFASISSP